MLAGGCLNAASAFRSASDEDRCAHLASPITPFTTEEDMALFIKDLESERDRFQTLISGKPKKQDIKQALQKSIFLEDVTPGRTGVTTFQLSEDDITIRMCTFGIRPTISFDLRGNAQISGPLKGILNKAVLPYLKILKDTIGFYTSKLNSMRRRALSESLAASEPPEMALARTGSSEILPPVLTHLERPIVENSGLKEIFSDLWRDSDALPGGSAGALIDEVKSWRTPRHLIKVQAKIKNIKVLLKDAKPFLRPDELLIARGVLADLQAALTYYNKKTHTPEVVVSDDDEVDRILP